jgi:flagella basal body P-ring formation protein FlgA
MRCWRKSTTWRGRAAGGLLGTALSFPLATGLCANADAQREAVAAIVAAVERRMGPDVRVTVEGLRVRGDISGTAGLVATLDPAARSGTRTRVVLKALRGRSRSTRLAEADGVVRVAGPHFEAAAPLARGDEIDLRDVRRVDGELRDVPLRRPVETVAGARAARPLVPGEPLMVGDVTVPATVRSGARVTLRVVAGGLVVSTAGIAAQDGDPGDVIRVVNASSGRTLRGQVVGPDLIEVRHGW